ncbi:hypothetical protein LCGC14_0709840 [marine sediment metagenome]|uniref:Uncharacterized protein n=1 Tax=marine sediment metagenome TaxID=412755 RepID=A0A0F9QK05_9ZZZZ
MTYTYVVLEVSEEAYREIRTKLEEADYQYIMSRPSDPNCIIDMHGIAIQPRTKEESGQ